MTEKYRRLRRRLQKRAARAEVTLRRLSWLRFAAFMGIPAALFLPGFYWPESARLWTGLGALVPGMAFALTLWLYERRHSGYQALRRALNSVDDLLTRLGDEWPDSLPVRASAAVPEHPYAGDLQVTGRGSLHQLLDRCVTRAGSNELEAMLVQEPHDPAQIRGRMEAQRELTRLPVFRAKFARAGRSLAKEMDDESGELKAFLEQHGVPGLSVWALTGGLLPAFTIASYAIFAAGLGEAYYLITLPLQVGLFAAFQLFSRSQQRRAVGMADALSELESLLRVCAHRNPSAAELRGMAIFKGTGAFETVRSLSRACGLLALRRNPVAHLFLGVFLLYDIHLLRLIESRQSIVRGSLERWFADVARLDAAIAVADYSAARPDHCWPELEKDQVLFEAVGLRHALLPESRVVGNDLMLHSDAPFLLVSGSNMSGKSTLLRSIGVGLLLARMGARVPATRLRSSSLMLYSSIQVQDDILRSTSLFYAEVRRIKAVLDAVSQGPVLFLLDEILRGTNERERHIAVTSIIRKLARSGSIGLVATHDMRLLEEFCGTSSTRCVHFQEQVSAEGRMSFDYRLREGPVQGTNALRILRAEGIEIDDSAG